MALDTEEYDLSTDAETLRIGSRVRIPCAGNITGTICGSPCLLNGETPNWPIALDVGFWNEAHTVFVSVLLAHEDNLFKPEDTNAS